MAGIFLKIVNMSISACWIVLAIILLRVLLKKAPKWINCILWGIAGLRLVMPFSFESIFSLIPSAETISKIPDSPRPHIDSGVPIIDNQVNSYLQGNYFEGVSRPMGNFVDITTILAVIWVVGIIALLIYTLVSFLSLKSKIGTAVLLRDNIYQSEAVISPFVLGIIKPKIYLPFKMNEQDANHVIAHEQAHIRRKDYLWKPLGFLILTLHWFNPLVWLGYVLLCRDIELACDEKVIKELNTEQKADYLQALLTCSVNRRMIAACPLAFGEIGVKDRVKSVLNYKKPAFWIIAVAIVASIIVAVCFLTNPASNTLRNIEFLNLTSRVENTVSVLVSDGETYTPVGAVSEDLLNELCDIKISRNEISRNRNENRDMSHTLVLQNQQNIEPTISSYIEGLQIHFNSTFTSVWVNNNVKPTLSYRVINPLKAKQVYEDIISSVNNEKITWTYNPSLSYTAHYTWAFVFDFDYTHIVATCTNGEMWNLKAEGQPKDTTLRFEKNQYVYWTPSEGVIGNIPQKSEVTLTIYNNETQLHKCTVVFECVSRDNGSAEFEIYLKVADGLTITRTGDGIKFVKQGSISNIGSADSPVNVIVATNIKQLKEKYLQFFNISTDGGLTVYIWQQAEDDYRCYLANTFTEAISDNSFAYETGATIPEMRAILTTYDISKENISINPVKNPLYSYHYTIDDEYREKIKNLFWSYILEIEDITNTENNTLPLGSFENPCNIGDSVRIKHGDINQKDAVYDYNASITLILTGTEAEERLKTLSSNYEEEKEALESFDLYLTRVHIKYNEESTVKDRLPTAFGVTAVRFDKQLQFIDPRFYIPDSIFKAADGEFYCWFPVLAEKNISTRWLSITIGTYQGAPGIISDTYFEIPPEEKHVENTVEFSGFTYIRRYDDANLIEDLGNGTIHLPEFPDSLKLQDYGIVYCADKYEAKVIMDITIQGFARAYYMENDGELEGNHKILKFKMTVPEPMIESLQNRGRYEDITAEFERNHYYLIPLDETHYAYIHLEGDDEAFADSIVKNAEVLIALP